jgi:VanZ family protein
MSARPLTWRRLASLWLPVVALMAAIFFASSRQGLATAPTYALDFLIKKTAHVLEYGALGLLSLRAWRGSLREAERDWRPVLLTIALCGAYALSDELHQLFVPTRSGLGRDVLIDVAAAMAAVAAAEWRTRRRDMPRS